MKDYKQHFVILNTLTIFVIMKTKVEFTYLDYLFKEVYVVKSKYYPDSTFFKKDDKVILELEKSGTLWVLYSFWSNISDMFSFDYNETQQLIKEWVEKELKLEQVTPIASSVNQFKKVEKELKLEQVTPRSAIAPPFRWRKLDSVKYAEIKPISNEFVKFRNAERRLNSEEVTPRQVVNGSFEWIQEQLKIK